MKFTKILSQLNKERKLKMDLTSENVEQVFTDCLFKDGENTDKHIKVNGITTTIGFHPERLISHKEDVQMMLQCLPDNFQSKKGGGWSFLNACNDKNGIQWTDLHQRMEQLFQLGIGLGLVKWQGSCQIWSAFPGGMPYVVILDQEPIKFVS